MFDYVKDAGLKFKRVRTKRKKTTIIILHHVQGKMSVQAIHDMHNNDKKSNYNGIAYNAYVDLDGTVYWGRGLEYEGGGTQSSLGLNPIAFQIVANGDFNTITMPEAQKEAIIRLARDICEYYGISDIKGHREVGDTDCPGKYFPLDEIRQSALAKEEEVEEKPLNQTAIEEFVRRLYHNVLNRGADIEGWNHWMNSLLGRQITPKEAAYGIIFSGEEMAQKEANEQFVVELYLGLLGRMPDGNAEGWSSGLYKDMSREDVFNGIVGSAEFQNIEKNMGF